MTIRKIVSLLATTFLLSGVSAQEKWDLKRAVEFAVANNISVKQADVQARIAALNLKQSRLQQLPTVNINGSAGVYGGYRFRKYDLQPMVNANGFVTFNEVPGIKASVGLSTNWLKTSYVNGMIYGIRIDRDIIPSKLNGGLFYRLVDYNYLNTNSSSMQHMAQLELSWQISRKLSLSGSYDGTFEDSNQYNSIYINLIKRF